MSDLAISGDYRGGDGDCPAGRTELRSQATDGLIAELRLEHPDLLLAPTIERTSDVTVEPEYWTIVDGVTLVYVSVHGRSFGAFETALTADSTVREPVLVDRYPDRRIYRVAAADRAIEITPETAAVGARIVDLSGSHGGWVLAVRLPDRPSLVALNDRCRELGISVDVTHIRQSDDGPDGAVGLTLKQQELLALAHEEGYFEVPRGISQSELAAQLGISKSAVSQRLRRAIAELCRRAPV